MQVERPDVGIAVVRQWWQVSEVIKRPVLLRPVLSWACSCVTHSSSSVLEFGLKKSYPAGQLQTASISNCSIH